MAKQWRNIPLLSFQRCFIPCTNYNDQVVLIVTNPVARHKISEQKKLRKIIPSDFIERRQNENVDFLLEHRFPHVGYLGFPTLQCKQDRFQEWCTLGIWLPDVRYSNAWSLHLLTIGRPGPASVWIPSLKTFGFLLKVKKIVCQPVDKPKLLLTCEC